jgi:ketosteroid isomerase-like protein
VTVEASNTVEHPNVALVRSMYQAVAEGDVEAFAGALADDVLWHESMPGFAGDYRGKDETLGLLGRVFEMPGLVVDGIRVDHVLADDTHAAVFVEVAMTLSGQTRTSRFVDLYGVVDGTLTEHWHLPYDPEGEAAFFGG